MSSQFRIQKKRVVEWDSRHYFNSSTLDSVIGFLVKYDEGYQVQSANDPNGYDGLIGCDTYEIDADLIDVILKKIDEGSITESDFPDDVDSKELVQFLNDCLMHSKNTGGYVYLDVF